MRKLVLLAVLFLAACQTTGGSTAGSGPITLNSKIQQHFDNYLADNGRIFSVAVDGRSSFHYSYCPDVRCRDTVGARSRSIERCEKYSNGVPCRVYAIREQVVWDFDGPALNDTSSVNDQSVELEKPTQASVLLQVSWTGKNTSTAGWLDVRNDHIKIQLTNGDWCSGPSRLKTKTDPGAWSVDCPDGTNLTGDYSNTTWDSGVKGRGTDGKGHFLNFWRANA